MQVSDNPTDWPRRIAWGFAVLIGVAAYLFVNRSSESNQQKLVLEATSHARPIAEPMDGYVSSSECRECHEHNHESWYQSYHRTMTQVATADTILGNFNNSTMRVDSAHSTYSLKKDLGLPWVNIQGPPAGSTTNSSAGDLPVLLTTGSHHMQVFWYPAGEGRALYRLPFVHWVAEDRFLPMEATHLESPDKPFPPVKGLWNDICIQCHATYGKPNREAVGTDVIYDTKVVEFGIACEACHGPAGEHVRLHREAKTAAKSFTGTDPIVNPGKLPHDRGSQVCGGCHAVHAPRNFATGWRPHVPGDNLLTNVIIGEVSEKMFADYRKLHPGQSDDQIFQRELAGYFWRDGMVRIVGREYNGLLESACHQRGEMSCFSCHEMHQSPADGRPVKEWADDQLRAETMGDQACVQCHDSKEFGTAHTHHAAGSGGSLCYNCHMPHTTYGLLKGVRSHTIESPSVKTSLVTGRPNACNLCHLDKSLDWAADQLSDWYGIEKPFLRRDERELSAAVLWALRGDAGQRALIAWHFGWKPAAPSGGEWTVPYLLNLMSDSYAAVRHSATESLQRIEGYEDTGFDFVASEDGRNKALAAIRAQWIHRDTKPMAGLRGALYDDAGQLNRTRFDELLTQRDNRPVILKE